MVWTSELIIHVICMDQSIGAIGIDSVSHHSSMNPTLIEQIELSVVCIAVAKINK